MHKPDFLIIGAARSSTSALARYLEAQPKVAITDPKEPHFLAHANEPPAYRGPGDDFLINTRVVSEPSGYQMLFSGFDPQVIVGEGSVTTFAYPETSIPNIESYCPPDVKLIVCLRNPVERMFSSYLYLRSRQREPILDFEKALEQEGARTAENWHHMWRYRALSRYDLLLPPFVERFGDRLHICISERLHGLDSPEFARIANFLELEDIETSEEFGNINSGGVPTQSLLGRITQAVVGREHVLELAKRIVPRSVQERLYDKMYTRPTLDNALASRLLEEFEPSIQLVESLVGPLPEWRAAAQAVE